MEKRAEFKHLSSQGYSAYLQRLVGDFGDNPKRFWSFLKCFKRSNGMSVLERDGVQVSDDVGKANLLNHAFAAKFSDPDVANFPDIPFSIDDRLTMFTVTEEAVRRGIW